MHTHKGNMAAIVIFTLFAITMITAVLYLTSNMQRVIQLRAQSSTKQYTTEAGATILAHAALQDICDASYGANNGILTCTAESYRSFLQNAKQKVCDENGVYKVSNAGTLLESEASGTIQDDTKDQLLSAYKNTEFRVSLDDISMDEGALTAITDFTKATSVPLNPISLTLTLKNGAYSIVQNYAVTGLYVVFNHTSTGIYCYIDDSNLNMQLQSQSTDITSVKISETNS